MGNHSSSTILKNPLFWLIIGTSILVIFALYVQDAEAVTRDEIDELDDDVIDARTSLDDMDEKIQDQRDLISDIETDLTESRIDLRETKRNATTSWDAALLIRDAESKVSTLRNDLSTAKDDLIALFNEQSDFMELISDYTDIIKTKEDLLSIKADLTNLRPLIGVDLSKSCDMLRLLNDTDTACPSMYTLATQLDSSNQNVTGVFAADNSTGIWSRQSSQYTDSWRWYDTDESIRIIVDPPARMADRIPMITITSNFGVYFTQDDLQTENNTRTYHKDIYVKRCHTGLISADTWKETLPYVIWSIRAGCFGEEVGETYAEPINTTEIDITTSPNWQYTQWLDDAKKDCSKVYGLCG